MPPPYAQRALQISEMNDYLPDFLRPNQQVLSVENFSYNVGPVAIAAAAAAAGVAATVNLVTQSDSDFLLVNFSALVRNEPYYDDFPACLLQITDQGSGKTFFNQPSLLFLIAGNQGFPFVLPTPRLIMPNTNLKFDFTNLGIAQSFYVTLTGLRIYYADPATAVTAALAAT